MRSKTKKLSHKVGLKAAAPRQMLRNSTDWTGWGNNGMARNQSSVGKCTMAEDRVTQGKADRSIYYSATNELKLKGKSKRLRGVCVKIRLIVCCETRTPKSLRTTRSHCT